MLKKLLIADDSKTIRRAVELCLVGEPITLLSAADGEDAIIKAMRMAPDLVIADVSMPKRSGPDLCSAFAATPALKAVPIILCGGAAEGMNEARALSLGAKGYLPKPFQSRALIDCVSSILGLGQSAQAQVAPPQMARPQSAPPPIAQPQPAVRPQVAPPQAAASAPARASLPNLGGLGGVARPLGAQPTQKSVAPTAAPPASPAASGTSSASGVAAPQTNTAYGRAAAFLAHRAAAAAAGAQGTSASTPAAAATPAQSSSVRVAVPPSVASRTSVQAQPQAAPAAQGIASPASAPASAPVSRPSAASPSASSGARAAVAPAAPPSRTAALSAVSSDALLREALSRASMETIERVVWEVVPQLAEVLIREQIERLVKKRAEGEG